MDRMTNLDASFLYSENEFDLHHNAWVGVFEGPAPTSAEFRALVASKLPRIPRYRQRVRFVPNDVAAPVWVDDAYFNLAFHVRNIALPAPGTDDQLRELFTTLMAEPLDRGKPLWVMWTVDGLENGRWALISKLHHCMADGATTTDITTILLDTDPQAVVDSPGDWQPEPTPTDLELLEQALVDSGATAADSTDRYATLMSSLRERLTEVDRAFASLDMSLSQSLSIESLNGSLSPYRRWAWARVELADIATVRRRWGGTVNDVVLAAVTRGFRDLLIARGEQVEGRSVRTMVPVSIRSAEDEAGNRVSSMYAELPVGVADPRDRLEQIRTQLNTLKASKQALAGDVLASLAGFQPPMLAAMGARAASHAASPVNTVTTNVPGPQFPLYALGRLMIDNWPYISLAGTVRIATTVFSYNGTLRIGVTGDWDTTADLDVFVKGLNNGFTEMLEASASSSTDSKPASSGAPGGSSAPGSAAQTKTTTPRRTARRTAKKTAPARTRKESPSSLAKDSPVVGE